MNLEITANTFNRITQIQQERGNKGLALKLSVLGGGCSGFQYKFDLVEQYPINCFVFEKDGAKIVIDRESALFLQNSKVDFVENLGSARFEIQNPNASAKCGCGSSFAV